MSTPEMNRAEINKANSQHSTGPITADGKKKSSLNALRHGLTGQVVVMPSEDLDAYQRHVASFTDEYNPKGATEAHLVQSLADTSWRLNRAAALETNLLNLAATGDGIQDALAVAASLESQAKALANLSMHSQRLSRQFQSVVTQLRDLQKTRLDQEKEDLNHLIDITLMYKDRGETYNPADDGFVFTDIEIDHAVRARNRQFRIKQVFNHRHAAA